MSIGRIPHLPPVTPGRSGTEILAVIRCPTCGHENPEGSQLYNSCGSALAVSAGTPREERTFVTVLFADLVGFTSRGERMDAEEVRAVDVSVPR
jgi:hypothetical protein